MQIQTVRTRYSVVCETQAGGGSAKAKLFAVWILGRASGGVYKSFSLTPTYVGRMCNQPACPPASYLFNELEALACDTVQVLVSFGFGLYECLI